MNEDKYEALILRAIECIRGSYFVNDHAAFELLKESGEILDSIPDHFKKSHNIPGILDLKIDEKA